jgi:predicted amidophosphoribosyltransferase
MSVATRRPEPPGFGRCTQCAYLKTGTPSICFACARKSIEGLQNNRCRVCDRPFEDDSRECRNPICTWDDRYFEWNYAAAMRSGALERALNVYKYEHQRGWAQIFARVLVGFLNEQRDLFAGFDLIVASPTYVGPDARQWDHTRAVLTEASELDEGAAWPFDVDGPPAIEKIAATERMMGKKWRQRFDLARGPLRHALRVSDPARTDGKQILVYDDVFTNGHTLNEVACCLRLSGGATRVCGITLARQPHGR